MDRRRFLVLACATCALFYTPAVPASESFPEKVSSVTAEDYSRSIGVTTHLNVPSFSYQTSFDSRTRADGIYKLLAFLDIKIIRDVIPGPETQTIKDVIKLAGLGIRFDAQENGDGNVVGSFADMKAFATKHPGGIVAVEGLNEVESFGYRYGTPLTIAGVVANQDLLYRLVKKDENFNQIPVLSFSLNYKVRGEFDSVRRLIKADLSNLHLYVDGLRAAQDETRRQDIFHSSLPIAITEGGFASDGKGEDSEYTQAAKTLEWLFNCLTLGPKLLFFYELMDDKMDDGRASAENYYGLFKADGTPKLVANSLHELHHQLLMDHTASPFASPDVYATCQQSDACDFHYLVVRSKPLESHLLIWRDSKTPLKASTGCRHRISLDKAVVAYSAQDLVYGNSLPVLGTLKTKLDVGCRAGPMMVNIEWK